MNSRKSDIRVWTVLLLAALILSGCGAKETVQQDTKRQDAKKEEAKAQTYTFRDVLGNEYEADILPDVDKSTYDYSRLVDENGYKYYTDSAGEKISKIGIDVSEYQPQADWVQVKASGIEFVMVRVGYRGYGKEGRLVEDMMFRQHIEGAINAGLDVGVYFFSQAVNDKETLEEAQFVLERIKDYKITYPVVFDTEEIKNDESRTDHLDSRQFTKNCIVFCEAVEDAGYKPMIYANMKWMAFTLDLPKLNEYDKWYADYEAVPQCPYEFKMWQYTETGSVPGVEGNVDINVMFP